MFELVVRPSCACSTETCFVHSCIMARRSSLLLWLAQEIANWRTKDIITSSMMAASCQLVYAEGAKGQTIIDCSFGIFLG